MEKHSVDDLSCNKHNYTALSIPAVTNSCCRISLMLAARAKMLAGLTLLTFWSLSFADRVWRVDFLLGGLPEPFQKKTWLFAWKTTSPLSVRFVKKMRERPSCSSKSHLLSLSIKHLPTKRAVIGHLRTSSVFTAL